ncbi:hypothetical protein SDC9_185350 [bioreactor metagenome]|uniref:Uncharacterized protein n=1 Tax=bioreactor metagenome TaxID=1076179 RepID=A0A645HI09_9ZZZZ
MPQQAGEIGDGFVVDGTRRSTEALAYRIKTDTAQSQDQGQKAILAIRLVQDGQPVFLPCTVKMADRPIGEQVEKGPT